MNGTTVTHPPPPLPPRRGRRIWLVAVPALIALLWILGAARPTSATRFWARARVGGEDEYPQFEETWSYGSGTTKVVRIAVDGPIFREIGAGFFSTVDPVEDALRQIRAAVNDKEVRGILLEVNSPGGAVTPCDEIHRALQNFRTSATGRRVVVHVRDMAASGGYYVAAAADRIVAEPTAIVGSIGVLMESLNWHILSRRVGVDATVIRSGENKDLLNPFRPVDSNHVAILQRMVDEMHARFRNLVAQGRGLSADEAAALADGSVFTAARARELKLVDKLGGFEDAVKQIAGLLDVETVKVVRYETRPRLWRELFRARLPDPLRGLQSATAPRLLMLWRS